VEDAVHAHQRPKLDRYSDGDHSGLGELRRELEAAPSSPVGAEHMYLMKREILELRRAVLPLAGPLRRLTGTNELVPERIRSYFRHVEDDLATVTERVTNFDDLLTTLVDATLAKLTLQQNNDMRKITSWAAIIAVPTMVVGVYGMNFDFMPELHWKYGYPIVITVTLVVCVVLQALTTSPALRGSP
jgi:magnesium transporter